jgi:agmatinase
MLTERPVLNLGFTGIASFAKYPICTNLDELNADVAVIGAPYDMGTQYRSGARFGPRGIRDGSTIYGGRTDGFYDPERDTVFIGPPWKVMDCGDIDMIHGDTPQCLDNIRRAIRKIVSRGAMPVVLGGDHAITAPIVEALDQVGDFVVVQIDAHLDFVDQRAGNKYGHGSPMRRASECKHVKGIAQLGIRGVGSSKREDFENARQWGSKIFSVRDIRRIGIAAVLEQIPHCGQYYVTLDADGFDPSIMPGNGSPSPGGFTYYEVEELLEGVAKKGKVVGFDFVEVAPMYDLSGATSQTAARVILDFIGFILKEREKEDLNR